MHKTLNYYTNNASELIQRYESAKMDAIHTLLLKTFPSNSFLLEIGCGSGRDAAFLHGHGYDVLATDGSEEMVAEAKCCHPELAEHLEIVQIPEGLYFEAERFDGVYSIAALMHLEEDAIGKIASILKPGGKFFFSVSVERDDVDKVGNDAKGRHFTIMSKFEWVACCEKYGLQLEHSEVIGDGLDREGIVWLTCVVKTKI